MGHVVIVGAGPAGASLSLLLARRGIEVTLLERRSNFAREFRGEVLMPSGVAALEQMGLADRLARVPSFRQQHIDVYMNGQRLFSEALDSSAASSPRIMAVSQPDLLEMLVAEAGASGRFRLIRGASVRGLTRADGQESGRVTGVHIRANDTEQTLAADLVVGADGRNSVVRREIGLKAREASPPMDIVWCKLPCPDGWQGVRAYAGRGHLLVAYHTWGDMLQLGWVILKGTFGDLRSRGIEQWVEEMAHHVSPDFADYLRAHGGDIERPFLLDVESDRVERWSVPGALVIGDAAHTMSPVGGQGINVALRDAIVSANHLVGLLDGPEVEPGALDLALDAIETERLPEVRELQARQAQPPKVLLTRAWWGEPVRRVAGALLRRPALRARAAGAAAGFLYGLTEVRLEV